MHRGFIIHINLIKQILDNALKYVEPETGKISIHIEEYEQAVKLVIKDNGPGISQEDLPRVFERGFTGNLGRYHKQATGIGLFLVKQLSNKLHLQVALESEEGVCVSILFPKSEMMFK